MSKVDDGGPAYPAADSTIDGQTYLQQGMSMRDRIMIAVLQGMRLPILYFDDDGKLDDPSDLADRVAQSALAYADAVMKRREQ